MTIGKDNCKLRNLILIIPILFYISFLYIILSKVDTQNEVYRIEKVLKGTTNHIQQHTQQKQHQQHQQHTKIKPKPLSNYFNDYSFRTSRHILNTESSELTRVRRNSKIDYDNKLFKLDNNVIEREVLVRVKRQQTPTKRKETKAVTKAQIQPPTPPPLPDTTTKSTTVKTKPPAKEKLSVVATRVTQNPATAREEVSPVEEVINPLPTVSTFKGLKEATLTVKPAIVLINPEGEQVTPSQGRLEDLSLESLADILESEVVTKTSSSEINIDISHELSHSSELDISYHTFSINFAKFFEIVKDAIPKIESKLKQQIKRLDPKPKIFNEAEKFYYFSSRTEYSFRNGLAFCAMHGNSKYFEVSNHMDYNLLVKLKNEDGKTMKDYIIWVDVEKADEGFMTYQSGKPIENILKMDVETIVPDSLADGHCMTFNPITAQYVAKPCTEKFKVMCVIEKSPDILDKLAYINNIKGYIDLIKRQTIGKLLLNKIGKHLNSLPKFTCDMETYPIMPLLYAGLENIKEMAFTEINWHKFPGQFEYFLQDIEAIRALGVPSTFLDQLSAIMHANENEVTVIDDVNNVICKIDKGRLSPSVFEEIDPTAPLKAGEGTLTLSEPTLPKSERELELEQLSEFYKFTLTDFILAVTSLVVTIIAVSNSIYLIYNNKCKKKFKRQDEEEEEEKELREEIKAISIKPILRKPRMQKINHDNKVTFNDENFSPPPQKTFWGKFRGKKLGHSTESLAESPRPVRRDSFLEP